MTSPISSVVAHVEDHIAAGLLAGDAKPRLLHHGVKANR